MERVKRNFGNFLSTNLPVLTAAVILTAAVFPARTHAQQPGQKTFSSPEEAGAALLAAEQNNDPKAMLEILGPDAKRIVYSGDDAEDANSRAAFVQKYGEMHRVVKEPDGSTTLYVGAENWPMPIPLDHKGQKWYFDSASGRREILYRRIGRNELSTIAVCKQLVVAQKEYYSSQNGQYAQKILSDDGQHDGLYWKVSAGQPESPIGPLVASAVAQGYTKPEGDNAPVPYLGYYYHTLTAQGAAAPGGAKSYIADGKMTGGFAFIAYPAEYRSSGVMTFLVGADGVVYQKDLGHETSTIAAALKSYNPNSTWQKVQDEQDESASEQSGK